MTLERGQRLAQYEIFALIGSGNMRQVYRARDTSLDRDVAIKILPADLIESEERLQRFELEAKVLAALNHPNIAGIFGRDRSGSRGGCRTPRPQAIQHPDHARWHREDPRLRPGQGHVERRERRTRTSGSG